MIRRLLAALLFGLLPSAALANFTITQGFGTTVFAIDATNQGTSLCAAAGVECSTIVNVDTAGAPFGVVANPFFTTITGALPAGSATIGAVTQASGPWTVSVPTWAGGTLGAMANYGTSPGAVLVPGVNAFITNAIPTGGNTIGAVTQASGPWTTSVTTWAGGTLAAMANYGTGPTGLVPGVNAYVTNAISGTTAGGATPGGSSVIVVQGDASGVALPSSVTKWGTSTLGSTAVVNYGSVPAAALVPAVNAYSNMAGLVSSTPTLIHADPCQTGDHIITAISQTTAANISIQILASAKQTYICQLTLFTAIANNVAVVEGTGSSTCTGGSVAGVIGGATAANGINLAANQGIVIGDGSRAIAQTHTVSQNLCLITSAVGPLAGTITLVQQ